MDISSKDNIGRSLSISGLLFLKLHPSPTCIYRLNTGVIVEKNPEPELFSLGGKRPLSQEIYALINICQAGSRSVLPWENILINTGSPLNDSGDFCRYKWTSFRHEQTQYKAYITVAYLCRAPELLGPWVCLLIHPCF